MEVFVGKVCSDNTERKGPSARIGKGESNEVSREETCDVNDPPWTGPDPGSDASAGAESLSQRNAGHPVTRCPWSHLPRRGVCRPVCQTWTTGRSPLALGTVEGVAGDV